MALSEIMMFVNNDLSTPLNELIGSPYEKTASGETLFDLLRLNKYFLDSIYKNLNTAYEHRTSQSFLTASGITVVNLNRKVILTGAKINFEHLFGDAGGSFEITMTTDLGTITQSFNQDGNYYLMPNYTISQGRQVEMWLPTSVLSVWGKMTGEMLSTQGHVEVTYAEITS